MECMDINKQTFWYALYTGETELTDTSGNYTGERELTYSDPVWCSANISAARGETQVRQFGDDVAYDRTILFDRSAPPIDEYSILWVDRTPDDGEHDYVVKKVGKSLNSTMVAISKVSVGCVKTSPST